MQASHWSGAFATGGAVRGVPLSVPLLTHFCFKQPAAPKVPTAGHGSFFNEKVLHVQDPSTGSPSGVGHETRQRMQAGWLGEKSQSRDAPRRALRSEPQQPASHKGPTLSCPVSLWPCLCPGASAIGLIPHSGPPASPIADLLLHGPAPLQNTASDPGQVLLIFFL